MRQNETVVGNNADIIKRTQAKLGADVLQEYAL